ncbi:hypothetical protein CTEN210_02723 [Chaetoceros tenuissimus]|uniref:F-box domain-containing protein n=1 Tax=Chaetoceros tenuissimus TaxID=426638 RepID=A0AAD3H1B9_9STRA|nr:hypothetical protein CTEN210_02723 [Chaetoceros tenuissimus]
MTTNGEALESGRKRARTEEASWCSSSIAVSNKNDRAPSTTASASNVHRAKNISNKLSALLEEFPEIKFIVDFENLQASVETAVAKYQEEEKHEARILMNYNKESVPLLSLPDEVLSSCISYVGKGQYGAVALASKKLNEIYIGEFGRETAYLEIATSVNLAKHCLSELCKNLQEKDGILKAAAVNGNLDILRSAVKDGFDLFPLVEMKKKRKKSNVDSDEEDEYNSGVDENSDTFDVYYIDDDEKQRSGRTQTVNLAKLVERGHLHVLKYLHEELRYFLGLQRYCKPAIEHGKLEILEWLRKIGIMDNYDLCVGYMYNGRLLNDFDYCECAIESGNVEVLKWLQKVGGYEINSNGIDDDECYVLSYAIESKSTEMIRYCLDLGYNNLNAYDIDYAIKRSKSVKVFRFMHELGYEFEGMTRYYSSNEIVDYFEIIKFLRSISYPWDDDIINDIVEYGSLEMIQYAHEDGCPWTPHGEEYLCLFRSNSLSVDKLDYLINNGCTFDYEKSSHLVLGLATKKELVLLDYFIGKNSSFDNSLFKEIVSWSGAWFEGLSYMLEKGKNVQNFNSIEEVFRIRPYITGIKSFHRFGLPWCFDSSRNNHLLSKIACYTNLENVKWAYENGCKGGDLVQYVEEEWGQFGIRSTILWKENRAFFVENGLLDETVLEKSGMRLNSKNVLEIGDSHLCEIDVSRTYAFFEVSLCSLKNLVAHGYKFVSETEQEFVCKEAYKKCCENPQNEDHRKRLALFVGMGVRDLLRKNKTNTSLTLG